MTMQEIVHSDYESLLAENISLRKQNAELIESIAGLDERVTRLEQEN